MHEILVLPAICYDDYEYRKNIFCRLSYSIRYIFETIMKQIGSSDWRDAYYCTPEEILAVV